MTGTSQNDIARFLADTKKRVDDLVAKGSWLVLMIGADPGVSPTYSYTVGLTEHGLPELAVVGLDPRTAQQVLNRAGDLMRANGAFRDGQPAHEVIGGNMKVVFAELPAGSLLHATSRYGATGYKALQLFWPDKAGLMPWEAGVDPKLAALQQQGFDIGRSPPTYQPN